MPPRPTTSQLAEWLEDIRLLGVNLTVWEEDFIESVESQRERWGRAWEPSEKVAAIIERIYTDRVP